MAKLPDSFEPPPDGATDDQALQIDQLDPAQKSLADALRVSFLILKVIMAGLVLYYVFISGLFQVADGEQAVRLRFGQIAERNIKVGPHFAWPYPIEEVIKISTTPRTLTLYTEFWPKADTEAILRSEGEVQGGPGPLKPGEDGYVITGDTSVVHAQASVTYEIVNTAYFISHIGDDAELGDTFVRKAAEQGIVRAAAQLTAEELLAGRDYAAFAELYTQEVLDKLSSGIRITSINFSKRNMPTMVYQAHIQVTGAADDQGQAIDSAERRRTEILTDTAGKAHGRLWELITAYERAVDLEDQQETERLGAVLDQAFATLELDSEEGTVYIGGEVAKLINAAKTYRTEVVEQVKSEAATFQRLLPEYRKNPAIVMSRMRQDAQDIVFTGNDPRVLGGGADHLPGKVETLYITRWSELRIRASRDPDLKRKREERALEIREGDAQRQIDAVRERTGGPGT